MALCLRGPVSPMLAPFPYTHPKTLRMAMNTDTLEPSAGTIRRSKCSLNLPTRKHKNAIGDQNALGRRSPPTYRHLHALLPPPSPLHHSCSHSDARCNHPG